MIRRLKLLFLMTFASLLLMGGVGYADLNVTPDANGANFKQEVTKAANGFTTAVRGVAGVATAAFVIWGAVLMLGAHGRSERISEAKSKFTYAVVGLVIIFEADKIVGLVMGIFGWQVPS